MDILIWLGVVVLFVIIEVVTLDLTSIWFSVGGLFAMLTTLVTHDFLAQFVVFAAVTLLLMFLFKPVAKKWFFKDIVKTNLDRVIGEKAIVTSKISSDGGEVKVQGKIWSAKNIETFEEIEADTKVEILEISGVKLIVKKI